MKTHYLLIAAACVASFLGCAQDRGTEGAAKVEHAPESQTAAAEIEPESGSGLHGTATFVQSGDEVTLTIEIENATPGVHAVHLHEFGDCSEADASSAGGHWNPQNEQHGHLGKTAQAHMGDIGNLEVDDSGKGRLVFTTTKWTIGGPAETDVVGKSIVVHAKADDFVSQPAGDAGDRVGCGVIGK